MGPTSAEAYKIFQAFGILSSTVATPSREDALLERMAPQGLG